MGLDQYLYRTNKKDFDALVAAKKLRKEYHERITKLYSEKYKSKYESFPLNECGIADINKMNEEQKNNLNSLSILFKKDTNSIANELNVELNEYNEPIIEGVTHGEEIAYWRKDWELHQYIIDNFWEDKAHDNVVNIPLTKENIEQIIEWSKNANKSSYKEYTEMSFKDALNAIEHGDVVYYHPWY